MFISSIESIDSLVGMHHGLRGNALIRDCAIGIIATESPAAFGRVLQVKNWTPPRENITAIRFAYCVLPYMVKLKIITISNANNA